MSARPLPDRNTMIAKIHIAKKDLRLDDDAYRDMLFTVTRFYSCSDIDDPGLQKVLDHLAARGWSPKPGKPKVQQMHEKVAQGKRRLIWRIEQWLAVAVPPRDENYAHALAKRLFHVERIEFCSPEQLHGIVAALEIDGKRNGWSIDKGAKHEPQRA